MIHNNDTITAISTGQNGAIAVIRISGGRAIEITESIFHGISSKTLSDKNSATASYGYIKDKDGEIIDDVVITLFRSPNSYTGEDIIEISCHGSSYIQQTIISLLLDNGVRPAEAGEFTQRAYLNGRMDLVQAEAVADIISSNSKAAHKIAMNQIRGGYSAEFSKLRSQLLDFASMLELELDFGEEDVEFANRDSLLEILNSIRCKISILVDSFNSGNAIKNGIPVAIVGKPNSGKSTLLNALLKEDRAIVSDIAGTTRDVIEETIMLGNTLFRFIDTAGIRHTTDTLENMGIERTFDKMKKADIIMLIIDITNSAEDIIKEISQIVLTSRQILLVILNKRDKVSSSEISHLNSFISTKVKHPIFIITAKDSCNIKDIEDYLTTQYIKTLTNESVLISNIRHYHILNDALRSTDTALSAMKNNLPTDFIAQDIRETIHHLSTLTGEITTDDILGNIFSKFCIGK